MCSPCATVELSDTEANATKDLGPPSARPCVLEACEEWADVRALCLGDVETFMIASRH